MMLSGMRVVPVGYTIRESTLASGTSNARRDWAAVPEMPSPSESVTVCQSVCS